MKKLICLSILALSVGPVAFATVDEEVEVTAPDLSGSTLPDGLGALVGMVGAAGTTGGTLKDKAMKAAIQHIAKQRANKKDQDSKYDDAAKDSGTGKEVAKQAGEVAKSAMDPGNLYHLKYEKKNPDGSYETLEIKDCTPSGVANPKNPCTQQKIEQFTDPTDGVERFVYSLAVVEGVYNPKHYDADASGYYPKVVDDQRIFVVFDTVEELVWTLQKISAS